MAQSDRLPRKPSSRVVGLDVARIFATLGIVWVHVAEIQGQEARFNTLGRFGTSFYILAAIFFGARGHFRNASLRTREVAERRARRLLIPYLMWCVIYAAFYFTTMYSQGHPISVITRYWGPLFGTAPHLWFLPFAFVAGVAASACVPRLLSFPGKALILSGVSITILSYIVVYGGAYNALDKEWITSMRIHRLARWLEETPLVIGGIFGMAIYGKYLPQLSRLGAKRRKTLAVCAIFFFFLTQVAYSYFLEDLGVIFWNRVRFFANVAGAFWMVAFVAARQGPRLKKWAPLGTATYFAYLSHQLLLDSMKGWLATLPGHGSMVFAIFSTLVIFSLAVGLGLLVSRVKLLRWLSP